MEIILLERVEKLGQMGDVVKVKPGYARNFLLPQGKALRANKNNLERFETEKAQREADNLSRRSEAETEAGKMDGLAVSMVRAASEMGQLFGSVTSRDIAEAVTEAAAAMLRRLADGRDAAAAPAAPAAPPLPRCSYATDGETFRRQHWRVRARARARVPGAR